MKESNSGKFKKIKIKYQLVLQFPKNLEKDFDWLISIEDKLIETLKHADIDGHDIGSGQMNIFILTNTPAETFDSVKQILIHSEISIDSLKSAYRNINENKYFCLWPKNLKNFEVI